MKMIFADCAAYVIEKPLQNQGPQSDFGHRQTLETLADTYGFEKSTVIGSIRNPESFAKRVDTYPPSGSHTNVTWDACLALPETDIILPAEMGECIGPSVQDCLASYLAQGHPTEGVTIWASYRQGMQGAHHNFGAPFASSIHFDRAVKNMLPAAGIEKNIVFTMSNCQPTVFYNQPFILDRARLEAVSSADAFQEVVHQLTTQVDPASILPTKNFDIVCSDGLAVHKQDIGPVAEERFFLQLLFIKEQPGDRSTVECNNTALYKEVQRLNLG